LSGNDDKVERVKAFTEKASYQSSIKEKNAEEAERAVDDFYKLQHLFSPHFSCSHSGRIPSTLEIKCFCSVN